MTWEIGTVRIAPIVEIEDAGKIIQEGIPSVTQEGIIKIDWLKPHFVDDSGSLKAVVQAFVVETPACCILVDTCIGNSKVRESIPEWNDLQTDFLSHLEKAGYQKEDIDIVICTHLHFDHVGWNTMLVGGKWVPTFPHARYLFVEKEFNYWKDHPEREAEDDHAGVNDSVLPVFEAGLVTLVPYNHSMSEGISLIPTPGHTPFHVSVLIKSGTEQAIITGDALHHPCQIAHPEWGSVYDSDNDQARISRKALLDRFADGRTLMIGSHFPAPTAGYLHREKDSFNYKHVWNFEFRV